MPMTLKEEKDSVQLELEGQQRSRRREVLWQILGEEIHHLGIVSGLLPTKGSGSHPRATCIFHTVWKAPEVE